MKKVVVRNNAKRSAKGKAENKAKSTMNGHAVDAVATETTSAMHAISEEVFQNITNSILNTYHSSMGKYLETQRGKILETDVMVLIAKIINASSLAMFYSVKGFLPDAPINYDILGQSICRSLRKSFKQIFAIEEALTTESQNKPLLS